MSDDLYELSADFPSLARLKALADGPEEAATFEIWRNQAVAALRAIIAALEEPGVDVVHRAKVYTDQLEAHMDEGGKINARNCRDLIQYLENMFDLIERQILQLAEAKAERDKFLKAGGDFANMYVEAEKLRHEAEIKLQEAEERERERNTTDQERERKSELVWRRNGE